MQYNLMTECLSRYLIESSQIYSRIILSGIIWDFIGHFIIRLRPRFDSQSFSTKYKKSILNNLLS